MKSDKLINWMWSRWKYASF